MSDWDLLFADSFFQPGPFSALVLPASEFQECSIDVSPLVWVDTVAPAGISYHNIVAPSNAEAALPPRVEEELDTDELKVAVQSADLDDYYGLLYLGHQNFEVDLELVKKNFKIINLICHPDKADPSQRKQAEVRFKAMQLAYDTLLDKEAKIEYDSNIDFDDSVPGPKEGMKDVDDFIATYYPVFERNAVYSTVKPVPMLGTKDSTKEEVDAFYKFWFAFTSWKEFTSGDTEKVGDSASRDARRRAAQKNKKARADLKKVEMVRIRKFVTKANDIDPRVKAFRAQAMAEAKAAKEAQLAAKRANKK